MSSWRTLSSKVKLPVRKIWVWDASLGEYVLVNSPILSWKALPISVRYSLNEWVKKVGGGNKDWFNPSPSSPFKRDADFDKWLDVAVDQLPKWICRESTLGKISLPTRKSYTHTEWNIKCLEEEYQKEVSEINLRLKEIEATKKRTSDWYYL